MRPVHTADETLRADRHFFLFSLISIHFITQVSIDSAMKSNPGTGELISIRNILRPGD